MLTNHQEANADVAPTTEASGVRLEHITKVYGDVVAVRDVSLDVPPGEFVALLGPSGSGKTTLLMTVAGFEHPTSGDVRVGDRRVTDDPPNKRNLGMVFQSYALFPHLSVADNVAFPLRMRDVSRRDRERRVAEALGTVRLTGYGDRRPGELSGGQQQRVALARAIVYRPPVLLMDEPLGALDKKLRDQLQLEIRRVHQELGTTVLYVTHDQQEALTMADRVAVVHDGLVEQLGTPEDLYERPASSFVADFIGEASFLEGRITARDDERCTVVLEGGHEVQGTPVDGSRAPALDAGSAARVAVRPERFTLTGADDPAGLAVGVVDEAIYRGDSVLYLIRLPGSELKATAPIAKDRRRWEVGERLAVGWEPSAARVYPAEQSADECRAEAGQEE